MEDSKVLDALDIAYQNCGRAKSASDKDTIIEDMMNALEIESVEDLAEYMDIDSEKIENAASSKQKSWVIDQLVRKLTEDEYQEWVDRFEYDDDDPSNINIWETGEEPQ